LLGQTAARQVPVRFHQSAACGNDTQHRHYLRRVEYALWFGLVRNNRAKITQAL
jgi:hypothetical protein